MLKSLKLVNSLKPYEVLDKFKNLKKKKGITVNLETRNRFYKDYI